MHPLDRALSEAKDHSAKTQKLIEYLEAARRLSAELGIDVGALAEAIEPQANGRRSSRRAARLSSVAGSVDISPKIDRELNAIDLENAEEVRKAYRRLWHHANKTGNKRVVDAFKKEWHDKLLARRRERQRATATS